MSKHENPDIASTLTKVLDAFSKSADKLSGAYRDLLEPQSHIKPSMHTLLLGALESMPAGVVVTDREGRIVLFNTAAEELTGLSREDIMGSFYRDIFGTDHSLLEVPEHSKSYSLSDIHIHTTPIGSGGVSPPLESIVSHYLSGIPICATPIGSGGVSPP